MIQHVFSQGEILTLSFLTITALSLFIRRPVSIQYSQKIQLKLTYWELSLLTTLVLGLTFSVLHLTAVLALTIQYGLARSFNSSQNKWLRSFLLFLTLSLFFVIATHQIPGFNNILLFQELQLKVHSAPASLYWNFDKSLAGIILVGLLTKRANHFKLAFLKALPFFILMAIIVFGFGLWREMIKLELDFRLWFQFLLLFIPAQLLSTCLAEEVFFRGIIQNRLNQTLMNRFSSLVSMFVSIGFSAILFGFVHLGGGVEYAIASTLAGVGYGMIYHKTKSLEMTILFHFFFNFIHLTLFSYPTIG